MAKRKKKNKSPLGKIKKQLDKLEALHVKEEAIIDNINEIIEDHYVLEISWFILIFLPVVMGILTIIGKERQWQS